MDIRNKKIILAENRNLCLYGALKNIQKSQPITSQFEKIFLLEPENIPKVNILANTKPISIAIKLLNPVIMHVVASNYDNENKDDIYSFRDTSTYLQSNLCVLLDSSDLFPIKTPDSVIYIKNVLFFRNEQMRIVNDPKFFSVINICPIKEPELINEHMKTEDFIMTTRIIETFFVTAYTLGHKSIILTNFGCNDIDKNPPEDIAFIYNYCIIKYGHLFDNIIITFELLNKNDFTTLKIFNNTITTFKFENLEEEDDYE